MEPKTPKGKLSLEEMDKIDALREAGRSIDEIAKQSKRRKVTITSYLNNREDRRKKAECVLTEEQKKKILELHGESLRKKSSKDHGLSLRKIKAALNLACSAATIRRVIKKREENGRDTVDAMEEDPEDDDEEEDVDLEVVDRPVASGAKRADDYGETDGEDVMEDGLEVGDVRSNEDSNGFQASRRDDPGVADGSPASEADGMDENEEDYDLEVGIVRQVFHEDVDDIEASRCSDQAEEVKEEAEVAEGHDEYEDMDDDEDVQDKPGIGRLPPWVIRNEFFDDFENFGSSTRNQPAEEVLVGAQASDAEEPEVEEMEVFVVEPEEASEVVVNQPELVRMGERTDVGYWSSDQVQAWVNQFLLPDQSVHFQRMKLTGAGLLHLHFDPQPPEGLQPPQGLEDVLQIIQPHLHPIADLERARIDEERESGVLLLENQDDDPGRRTFKSSQCFMNAICCLLFSCKEVRDALSRESADPLLQMISGIFSKRTNSARGWRFALDSRYHTEQHDIRSVFPELMKTLHNHENRLSSLQFTQCKVKKCVDCQDIDFRFTNGEVWSTMDVNFLTVYNGSFNDSVRAAYSPVASGACSHCGGVVQQTIVVEAQQARYHFARISGAITDINSESEVAMFGHQWRIRGFAERVLLGTMGHFVSWIRVLDHWHLVNDEQSEDKGCQAVEFGHRNIMILVFEKIL